MRRGINMRFPEVKLKFGLIWSMLLLHSTLKELASLFSERVISRNQHSKVDFSRNIWIKITIRSDE